MLDKKWYFGFIAILMIMPMLASPVTAGEHIVASVAQTYATISVEDAKAFTQNTTGLFILDVRTQAEYDAGYIEDAILIPHTEIQTRTDELPTNKSAPILVYCGSGVRSANASEQLDDLGYTTVYNMDNGLIYGWIPAGYFTTIAVKTAKDLARYTPELFILDVRTQAEYDAGYIEDAILIPHTEIQTRTDELPTNKSETLLVYCGSGGRSANASQQLEDLGYTNVRNMANGMVYGWIPAGYFTTIAVKTAKDLARYTPELFIVDVRTQAEYDAGYIDGAVLIPHTEIASRVAELPTNMSETILVYCGSGGRSANASQQLEDLGYTNIRNMANGMVYGWIPAGYFTTIAVSTAKALIDGTPGLFILDVRTQAEYDAAYIEGAVLIPHTEIASRVAELPTNMSETILVYCGSGKRSANASQQLEDLGYTNIRNMADGLMYGWIPAGYPFINGTMTTTTESTTTTETATSSESEDGSGFGLFLLAVTLVGFVIIRRRK